MLEDSFIMHLHLGGKDSDVFVFLIQYAAQVVLLVTNTHGHQRTRPAGKNILALSNSWLWNLERDIEEAEAAAASARIVAERQAAENLKAKRAAAIAAFKRKAGLE